MTATANDNDGVTMSEFAKLTGLTLAGIRHHAQQGHIKRQPNGKWNPDDAEALTAFVRSTRSGVDPRNEKLLKARVLGGAVKTKRITLTVKAEQARSIERQPLEVALQERCEAVLSRVSSWPDRYAAQLAEDVSTDPATALAILREFAAIALDELGDLRSESLRYVDQGSVAHA